MPGGVEGERTGDQREEIAAGTVFIRIKSFFYSLNGRLK